VTLAGHQAARQPAALDPYDYAFQEDPYPVYAWLREHEALHHNPDLDLWALSRHADIAEALRTEGTYSSSYGVAIEKSAWGPDAHKVMSILGMDPPRQKRLRSLVSRGFTPRRVHELLPRIQQLTDRYLDQCLEMTEFDWIGDFAGKLPMDVISEMMGVPEEDRAEVRRQADIVVHREDGVYDVPAAGAEASLWLVAYYQDMVAQRRRQPADDLTSALIQAKLDDGSVDGDRLEEEDVIAFLFLMVVAGNETTTKLLGHALFHLTRHPDQLEKVLAAPDAPDAESLVVPWVEETLRFDTSSQLLARYLMRDVELHGRVAPEGSKLLLCLGSANRDERVFSRADEYDIFRDPGELGQLLSFGGGRHFCLGANLARLEARVALTALVQRVRQVEVDHERCVRVHSLNVRGFASVPMTVEAR
jgi:cytochrome P450